MDSVIIASEIKGSLIERIMFLIRSIAETLSGNPKYIYAIVAIGLLLFLLNLIQMFSRIMITIRMSNFSIDFKFTRIEEIVLSLSDFKIYEQSFKRKSHPDGGKYAQRGHLKYLYLLDAALNITANKGLFKSLLGYLARTRQTDEPEITSVVGHLVYSKSRFYTKAFFCIIFTAFISAYSTASNIYIIPEWFFVALAIAYALIYVNRFLVGYRVANGYFGSTRIEALSILEFINQYSNPNDFFDGDRPIRILQASTNVSHAHEHSIEGATQHE